MKSAINQQEATFWGITSYFNPMRYQRRLANYRSFRSHLTVPLVTVELSYNNEFDLLEDDAEVLVRLRGRDILWQKERLLNVALRALPGACRKVAWLDCDIIFARDDWADGASDLLDRFQLIQLFRNVHHLPQDCLPGEIGRIPEMTEPSFPYALYAGLPTHQPLDQRRKRGQGTCSMGVAWATSRELIEEHGFYDACIVGGGDSAIARAAYGNFERVMQEHEMNEWQKQRYLTWARPYFEAVREKVSFVDCDVFHLWHGDMQHRRYRQRHEGLAPFEFDPFRDVAVEENGCWRWNSNKRELHEYVKRYFATREEDG